MNKPLLSVWQLYYDGFRSMTVGRQLWLIILLKLFFMFAILKIFFFPNVLGSLGSEAAKSEYVGSQLIERSAPPCATAGGTAAQDENR